MLAASRKRILESLSDDDLVLDVGGWAKPLARADWVIDLMPYGSRGLYGEPDPEPERFSERTWVERDFCDREPWPFTDDQFDFAVCSHALEDVRDPVWVCSELNRVARAGYVEVPSRLEEQSEGVHGNWVGWSHHRWLVDVEGDRIRFVFKSHAIHGKESFHFARGYAAALTPEERVQTLFWSGGFSYEELVFLDAESHDAYLTSFVDEHRGLTDGRTAQEPAGFKLRDLAARVRSRARPRPR